MSSGAFGGLPESLLDPVRQRLLYGGLAALGLALYLWPALSAPVVRWSDSELDLDWARRGVGIFSPVVSPHHPPKPGYILFLRAARRWGRPPTRRAASS